ncbi:choline/ethanolamine kinase family protein [Desulfitibacter alkalitolerans]|uniref:choline/ethanolamine kinase family protein n=1 Tax=Desulfitibacter alkalitolerans TaxID=264641 RepID=UPI000487E2BB|nr:choline/ethanolamine kinase family protein [Desulfitibacter alkalitolerans]
MQEQIILDSSMKLDHVGRILSMISKVPYFTEKNARVSQIEYLLGGLTNSNYKVTIDGKAYAIRVAGDGTTEYLNRPAEKHNASLMSDMDINAKIFYYDETTGNQICSFIEGKTMHIPDFQDEKALKMAAQIFKKYHYSGLEFMDHFDPIRITDEYNALLAKKDFKEFFEGFDKVREKFEAIKEAFEKNPPKLAPCHNDPLPENYILNGEKMYLIDWEYSGMCDPSFDLAALIIENNLTPELEKVFLEEYFGGELTMKQYGQVVINKFLCDALWSIWALLQIATGKPYEDYWPYGLNRFHRALGFMNDENFDNYIEAIKG